LPDSLQETIDSFNRTIIGLKVKSIKTIKEQILGFNCTIIGLKEADINNDIN
jgi:hypothetical protein